MNKGWLYQPYISYYLSSSNEDYRLLLCVSGDASEMVVMWTTFDPTNQSTVQYGEHGANLTNTANGNMVKFVDGGSERTVRYMHTVKLTALKPASKYGKLLL